MEYERRPLHMVDMFFFPIMVDGMYHAVTIDTKRERIFVLDSMLDVGTADEIQKYDDLCSMLRRLLADYLSYEREEQKAKIVSKTKIHLLRLKWADRMNKEDTGVYMMRHLETFMGDCSASWKCMSALSRTRQLRVMRVRYCATLIAWERNEIGGMLGLTAADHYKEICKDENLNINLTLIGS
ncbi:uncharacterized protein LOC131008215 [Salvia miltiorrhiza]|uniref:uncharacterized protein LOC131008215 n=1 Tax=Salvia miltiorrhiza TaxID=226208 RepID=UPI0025AD0366|nr:uncharacterized protein LOC131008215 [Salvia miltiorrhiza]